MALTKFGSSNIFGKQKFSRLNQAADSVAAQFSRATGGTITQSGGYTIHTFTSSGNFVPTQNLTVDYLVVAGGASGAGHQGGGGGAGGLRCTTTATGGGGSLESPLSLTNGVSYTVTIGAGGAGVGAATLGNNGQ
jgi:hypothetical protein